MEDFVYYGILFDIYKDLLNESSIKYFSLYYEENLSMQEIADNNNVSKSYVGNLIKNTTEKLLDLEAKMHIYQKKENLTKLLEINDLDELKANLLKELNDD